jgi:hypothetical protein
MKNLKGSLTREYYDLIWKRAQLVLEDLGLIVTNLILWDICLPLDLIHTIVQSLEYNPLIYFEVLSLLIWFHYLQLWYFCNEIWSRKTSLMLYFSSQEDSFLKLDLSISKSVGNNHSTSRYCSYKIKAAAAIFTQAKFHIF